MQTPNFRAVLRAMPAVLATCLAAPVHAATVNWTGGAGAAQPFWDRSANWDAGVPTANDIAADVAGGTAPVHRRGRSTVQKIEFGGDFVMRGGGLSLTAGESFVLGTLTLSGGSLFVEGQLRLGKEVAGAGGLAWTGGQFRRATAKAGGGRVTLLTPSTISGGAFKTFAGGIELRVESTLDWTGGSITREAGAVADRIVVAPLATLTDTVVNGHSLDISRIDVDGRYVKRGPGTTTVNAVFDNLFGTTQVQGGRLILQNPRNYDPDTQTLSGGVYEASGSGKLTINLANRYGADRFIRRNDATLRLVGPNAAIERSVGVGALDLLDRNDGRIDLVGRARLRTTENFENTGDILLDDGGRFVVTGGKEFVQSGGTLTLDGGVLRAGKISIEGGKARGEGILRGGTVALAGKGVLEPDSAAEGIGVLEIDGDFAMSGGVLAMNLTGGVRSDFLLVTGKTTLGGTLDLRFAGLTTAPADPIEIIESSGGLAGRFATVDFGPVFGGTIVPSLLYSDTAVFVVFAPIPEPGTWALLLTGGAVLAAGGKYRRSRERAASA